MKKMLNILCIIPIFSLSYAIIWEVEITDGMVFEPSTLAISVGDTVLWTNNHTGSHTATSTDIPAAWTDANISPGGTFLNRFANAGTFPYDCAYHSPMTGIVTVSALGIGHSSVISESFQLHASYPNPFNPTTNIKYSLLENAFVELIIYDIQGQQIQALIDDFRTVGAYSINWDASLYPSGLYFVKMTAGKYVSTEKLMLIK